MPQVMQKIAVKQCFALFLQPQGAVDLITRLARHHAAQELHIGGRNLHVHHEVGTGETEQHQQIVFTEKGGINHELRSHCGLSAMLQLLVQHRQGKRNLIKTIDQLAHHIRTLVAKKQAGQHLDLEVGAHGGLLQTRTQRLHHPCGIAGQIFKCDAQSKILHDLHHHGFKRLQAGVVGTVSRSGF